MGEYLVTDYGADATGKKKSTRAIQEAIDAASSSGGGTVVVPAGTYEIGTITLRSHIRFRIDSGAVLLASADLEDYVEQAEGHVPPEFPYVRCLIVGFDLEDVEIAGGGTLDCRGRAFFDYDSPRFDEYFTEAVWKSLPPDRQNEYGALRLERPTWMGFFRRCKRLRLHDFEIRDASRWTFRFSRCDGIHIRGMAIANDLRAGNSDGMHFTGCTNIHISDSTIVSGDDCIAITNYGDEDRDTRNVTVTGCVLTSHSAGVRIGFRGSGVVEDVAISNCVICNSNRGIGIFAGENEVVRHISISNCRIATKLIAGAWWGKGEPLFLTNLGPGGRIEDVGVFAVSMSGEQGIVLYGSADAEITDVRLKDVRLRLGSGAMGPHTGGTIDARPREILRRAVPPLLARRVKGLRVDNLHVSFDDSVQDYLRHGPEFENCKDLSIVGYTET